MSDQLQFLHSTYKKIKKHDRSWSDALMICAKDVKTNESKFLVQVDPMRTMYTVKKALRNEFSVMKEAHHKRDLEERRVYNHALNNELAKALDMWGLKYVDPVRVLNSPYSAGNDIPIDVLYKHAMNEKLERTAENYKVGALDIETDIVNNTGAILCIAYVTDDHKVYLSILRSFLKGKEDVDAIRACCIEKVAEFTKGLNTKAQKVMEKNPVKEININICQTEIEQLRWIWNMIHKEKDEVLSIWNMRFDMKVMEERMLMYHADPAEVMCHPEAPSQYRVCKLTEDNSPIEKLGHHTYRWDVMELSGYTQPIDSMCLFSRLRRVDGLRGSYGLGAVAADTIGSSKMDFGDDGHYQMQTERQVEYCAYNVIDSLILTVQDKVTNDVGSMFLLTQNSVLPAFAKQTVQLTHSFFKYLKDIDMVPGSCQGNVSLVMEVATGIILPYATWTKKYGKKYVTWENGRVTNEIDYLISLGELVNLDDQILNTGGGVLNPLLTHKTGVPLLEETDDEVNVAMAVSDLDVAST